MPAAEPKLVPVYFDSALIAKFYLNEPGRELVRQIARPAGAVVRSGIEQKGIRLTSQVLISQSEDR